MRQYIKIAPLIVLFIFSSAAVAKEENDLTNIQTNVVFKQGIFKFIIDPEVNIEKFTSRISLRKLNLGFNIDKSVIPSDLSETEKNLFWKFYVIFRKVQNLLNMHSAKPTEITIYIHHDYKKIKGALKNAIHSDAPAYFNTKEKTLYITAKKCDEYILAHELAHAIIANYFLISPPVQTQEILAMYCDAHLKDDNAF